MSTNKVLAKKRLEAKLRVLEEWAQGGVPVNPDTNIKEFFPVSLRQFNFWDFSLNSASAKERYPDCGRTANDTLRQYPLLRASAETLISALRRKDKEVVTKIERVGALKKKNSALEEYVSLLEKQLVILRLKGYEDESRLKLEAARLSNVLEEERSRYRKLEGEAVKLRVQLADLTRKLNKVVPMCEVIDEQ